MKEIIFYRTKSGNSPIEEFLDSLSARQAQKVTWVLRLIEEIDPVPNQYLKKLVNTDDIWEVRVESGRDEFRLLGFLGSGHFIVLNHAFHKKTQQTPLADIRLAEQRKAEYMKRRRGR